MSITIEKLKDEIEKPENETIAYIEAARIVGESAGNPGHQIILVKVLMKSLVESAPSPEIFQFLRDYFTDILVNLEYRTEQERRERLIKSLTDFLDRNK